MAIPILASGAEWARIGESYFWPGGAILLALLLFRQPLAEFVSKLRWFKASAGGIEGATMPPDQGPPPSPPGENPPPPSQQRPSPPTIETADADQIRPFVYYWFYEKMYRTTHGTQLMALQFANIQPAGAARSDVEQYFEEHERRVRAHGLDYTPNWDQWISHLTSSGFLNQVGDRFHVTPIAKSFLQWMTAEGIMPDKFL